MSDTAARFLSTDDFRHHLADALGYVFESRRDSFVRQLFESPTRLVYCPTCDRMVDVPRPIASTAPWQTDTFRFPAIESSRTWIDEAATIPPATWRALGVDWARHAPAGMVALGIDWACRRPSRGWARHVRRMKQEERR